MKTAEVIFTIKKCIKKIECSTIDMHSMTKDLISVRRFLFGLGMDELANDVKYVNRRLSKSDISRRSMVSRLETVIHELGKLSAMDKTQTNNKKKTTAKSYRNVSRFDLILAPIGEGYSYCLVSEVIQDDQVSVFPIRFFKDGEQSNIEGKSYSLKDIDGVHQNAYIVGNATLVPYQTARHCFVERYPVSEGLQKAVEYMTAC